MEPSDLRDNYKQQKYRKASVFLGEKDCSHIYSLYLTTYIQNSVPGPKPIFQLSYAVNSSDNFRMVQPKTNRSKHKKIDKAIIEKFESGDILTLEEEKRARLQVKFLQGNVDISDGHYKGAIKFYKGLKTKDGKTLWDLRSG